jgi:hypothetical protein
MTAPARAIREKENVMHPVTIQTIAAERTRDFRARAAAAGQTRQLRRARRGRAFAAIGRASRGVTFPLAGRPLRGPRPA